MTETPRHTANGSDGTDTDLNAALAQFITGVVTAAATGDPVEGATITLTDANTGATAATVVSDPDGEYTVQVAAGTYDLAVETRTYDPATATVTLGTDETASQDFALDARRHKVSGSFADDYGFGVLGRNTSESGVPVGVRGSVPNSAAGYGLETPDDALVAGVLESVGVFEAGADNTVGLRIFPAREDSAGTVYSGNVVGGYAGNAAAGVDGASIGGGGQSGVSTIDGQDRDNINEVAGDFGTIGGGYNNLVYTNSTIGGGYANTAGLPNATVGGGYFNSANGLHATVGGGYNNDSVSYRTTVGGGENNTANGSRSTVGGGQSNTASGGNATVGGGYNNTTSGSGSTVGGGVNNAANENYTTIGGGSSNKSYGQGDTIGGGTANRTATSGETTSTYATVPGGRQNVASGAYSFAAGRRAKATDQGAFVWADSTDADVTSTGTDQFIVAAAGGVGINETAPETQLHVTTESGGTAVSDHAALVEDESASNSRALAIRVGDYSSNPPSGADQFLTCYTAGDADIGSIRGNGSGGIQLYSASADYAEFLPRRDPGEAIDPGDVVGVHAGAVSKDTAGATEAMVVSDRPIVTGNAPGPEAADREDHEVCAFVGQVPVRVRDPVAAGDLVVPSGDGDGRGRGVAADEWTPAYGPVVGRAWTAHDGEGAGEVTVAVGVADPGTLAVDRDRVARLERETERKDERIDGLEAENEALRERNAALESRLAAVETHLGLDGAVGDPAADD